MDLHQAKKPDRHLFKAFKSRQLPVLGLGFLLNVLRDGVDVINAELFLVHADEHQTGRAISAAEIHQSSRDFCKILKETGKAAVERTSMEGGSARSSFSTA